MQYYTYNANKYQYWTHADGRRVREGQDANGYFVRDVELYVGGFADAENVGWQRKQTYEPAVIAGGKVRIGIDDCKAVIDGEITSLGNWERIQTWE